MFSPEGRPAALRDALRLVLVEANGVPLVEVEQAVLCCFCNGSMLDRVGADCEVPRQECPKVFACGHKRDCTC
ncbi:hypothetical protein [Kineosporia sp. A_224]|uniref:hypothetical protein n=1 Tax=Kineosporia sp. A_224 TaxID=1962180 RepID=UPI000B4B5795|nr:hypothetical protein [Kineosporia sp. A_224]